MKDIQLQFHVDRGSFELDVAFSIPGQGVTAIFGPSGSGKTSCLRAIAGLERFANSHLSLGEQCWQNESQGIFVPSHQRAIAYVFQEASLFAHLSVQQNLEFGFKRLAADKRKVQPETVIELLGLSPLLQRPPTALSGGERQRVAIGRALLTSPEVLLMDEPLSALDRQLKCEILPYLENLHRDLAIPVVYVSHSPEEVARLADHIIMLDKGKVVREGPISEVILDPQCSAFLGDGASSLFEGRVSAQRDDLITEVNLQGLELHLSRRPLPLDFPIRCRIYASDVSLCTQAPTHSSIMNILPATIAAIHDTEQSGEVLVTLDLAHQQKLLAQISHYSLNRLNLQLGGKVWAQVKSVAVL